MGEERVGEEGEGRYILRVLVCEAACWRGTAVWVRSHRSLSLARSYGSYGQARQACAVSRLCRHLGSVKKHTVEKVRGDGRTEHGPDCSGPLSLTHLVTGEDLEKGGAYGVWG